MHRTTDKAAPFSLQEPRPLPTEHARDEGGAAPSPDLSGWLLWVYVGVLLATIAALVGPPVWRWLERVRGAL